MQKQKTIWTYNILGRSIIHVIFQSSALVVILLYTPSFLSISTSIGFLIWDDRSGRHYCVLFATLIWMQLLRIICCKCYKQTFMEGITTLTNFKSASFIEIFIGVNLGIIQFGGRFMRTVPLTLQEHLFCVGVAVVSMMVPHLLINCGAMFCKDKDKK